MSDMSMFEHSDGGAVPEWTFTDRLRKARESAGLDQAALAALLAKKRSTVSNWERGTNRPDDLALRAIAHYTDVSYLWLKRGVVPNGGGSDLGGTPTTWNGDAKIIAFPTLAQVAA